MNRKGFTLVEILVVLAIMMILTAVVAVTALSVNTNLTARSERAGVMNLVARAATIAQSTAKTATLTRTDDQNLNVTLEGNSAPVLTLKTKVLRLSSANATIATFSPTGRTVASSPALTAAQGQKTSTMTLSLVGQARWNTP